MLYLPTSPTNLPANKIEGLLGTMAEGRAVDGRLDIRILGHEAQTFLHPPEAARQAAQQVAHRLRSINTRKAYSTSQRVS